MTPPPPVPRLAPAKPYRQSFHLRPGLRKVEAPALPRGYQIKCDSCRCSVDRHHVPNSDDCMQARLERDWSQADG